MLTMPREAIVGWLEENGARVHRVATRQDPSWRYVTYVAQRTI